MRPRLLYVIRHGETDWNAAQRWQGHTDIPLNASGRAQARAVAEALRGLGLAGVVTSDLSRAHETGLIVAEVLGIAVGYVDAGLRERTFGCFEGLSRAECERTHPQAWWDWLTLRRPPEGAEAHEALTERMVAAVGRAAERVARDDAPGLVVTHGGSLRALVVAATGELPPPIANVAVWRVGWRDGALAGAKAVMSGSAHAA
jgi:broad specificity phosphatase PhoE